MSEASRATAPAERDPAVGRLSGALGICLAACGWGTWSLFFRPAERRAAIGAPLEAFVVFAVIFLATAPLAWRDRLRHRRPLGAFVALGLTGVFDALNALFFFWAMQRTSLAVAVLTHYLAPVLVALAAPVAVGERVSAATWLALFCALLGLFLLVEPWRASSLASLAGAGLGATSAFFFAASLLVSKRLIGEFAPTEILSGHLPTALLTLWLFLPRSPFSVAPSALGLVALAGLGPGAISGVLFIRGLARVEASRASILMLLEPVVAVLCGIVVWHEPFGAISLVGSALVLAAAVAVVRGARR